MTRDGITDGLICVLSCVEPCRTYDIHLRSGPTKQIHPVARDRKRLHLYFDHVDREFGFMHVRVQTWLPLTIDVYVNGREWLARRLTRSGVHAICKWIIASLRSPIFPARSAPATS